MELAWFCYSAIAVVVPSNGEVGSQIAVPLPRVVIPLREVLLLELGCFWLSQCQAATTSVGQEDASQCSGLRLG